MHRAIKQFVGSGDSARNVLRMVAGTTMAQVIGILALIPLARMYTPQAFGFFALFQSIVALGVTVASLRYDVAIVLPEHDDEARVLRRLSLWSIAALSLALCGVLWGMQDWVAREYKSEQFSSWLVAAGVAVFISAQISNIQFWLTRTGQFNIIASNRVMLAALVGAAQIAAYFMMPNVGGLVVGLLTGSLIAMLVLVHRTPSLRQELGQGAPTKWEMAKRYKKMPLLNGPNALLDAVKMMAINLLIGQIAVSDLGEYNMAWRLTMAPASLIQGAIAQVFLQKMSVAKPGELTPLLTRVLVRIGAVTAPVFLLYYAVAPWGFTTFLGLQWGQSGELARALIPWVFMLTFSSPLSNVFIVTETQQWLLLFAIAYTICPITLLMLSEWSLVATITGLSWLMAGLLVGMLGLAFAVAKRFDASARV